MANGSRKRRSSKRSYRRKRDLLTEQRGKKYYKRLIKPKNMALVNRIKPGLNVPINPRFLTKFTASLMGYVPAGTASGHFWVKQNSPYFPFAPLTNRFNGEQNGTGEIFGAFAVNGTTALEITQINSRGFTNLCSALMYAKFRVYASKIKVTAAPQTNGDNILLSVVPLSNNSGPITGGPSQIQNVAYSKEKVISAASDAAGNTISHYIDVNTLDGVNNVQLMADDKKVGTFGADPEDKNIYQISWSTLNNTALAGRLPFNVEVTYYTELFEMNYDQQYIV